MTDPELLMFMSLCKYQKLNPFLNEAYLIKFGDDAQIVVGKETYLKRANSCTDYDGHEAGIIIERDGKICDVEGCFHCKKDILLGGWAKVYMKSKSHPSVARISLVEYDKGQSIWKQKPATMIRKVALVQALREAFPEELGALYTEDELPVKPIENQIQDEIDKDSCQTVIDIEPVETPEPEKKLEKKPETKTEKKGCGF